MGASTGSLLVDDPEALLAIFKASPLLIATHCEDSKVTAARRKLWGNLYGTELPPSAHPFIRNDEACFASSSFAVELAQTTGASALLIRAKTTLWRDRVPTNGRTVSRQERVK